MKTRKPNTTLRFSGHKGEAGGLLCQLYIKRENETRGKGLNTFGLWRCLFGRLTSTHKRSNPSSLHPFPNPCNSTPLHYSASRPTLAVVSSLPLYALSSPIVLLLSIVYTYPRAHPQPSPSNPRQGPFTPLSAGSP